MFSKTYEEHVSQVKMHVSLLKKAKRAWHLGKCGYFTEKVDYTGQVIRTGRFKLALHPTNVIRNRNPSGSVPEWVKSVLDICNVYRRSVPNSAGFTALLTKSWKRKRLHKLRNYWHKEIQPWECFGKIILATPVFLMSKNHPFRFRHRCIQDTVSLLPNPGVSGEKIKTLNYWPRVLIFVEKNYKKSLGSVLAFIAQSFS